MKYALLIYQDNAFEEDWASADDDRRRAVYAEYGKFGRLLEQRNAMVGGSELAVSRTATTMRKHNGDVAITDGPFAEVAEQLGGFYIVEARDIDEALELARALPSDVVEVRPVIDAGDRPDG